ncbi:coniferyl-aldehyde dehydrogenase [Modicisalibacter ilicicola DSM 19980]|uniref:Aldehyde dehydrogenase n=1 Tax=Modicisalibacter ilicicola DSM 19980 TaxID=1121942 RepID=A0A1M4WI35_9GAMM|nr:coniferyl aldehyde dehydrogenase [Halomonas ilicicola]SHE80830.1 coniferyl-aldehyde dehydrogenase [Halomonas ilicicola DSM 19980]
MTASLPETPHRLERMQHLFEAQRQAYEHEPVPEAAQRIDHLRALRASLVRHQEALIEAIDRDYGRRSGDETRLAEILPTAQGIDYAVKRVRHWMKPSRRRVGLAFQPGKARVVYQPLGVVGIIVPWNYPFYLALGPLTAALAAGNRAMLKMSEFTPATAEVVARLLDEVFDETQVAVVTGEAEVGKAFSQLPFDHLLFTGSTAVGRQVMRAAAANLTPVTLELGGKSPAIVSRNVPIEHAAERIAFGKGLNAGQTCVAPDYVLCPRERVDELVEALRRQFTSLYPALHDNPDYTWIVNDRQHGRLKGYLDDALAKGARAIAINPAEEEFDDVRVMPPTLVLDVDDTMRLMQEEIFGPLLPIVPVDSLEDAMSYVARRPRPLALYYFGYDRAEQRRLMSHTHAGGMCVNDSVLHVAQEDLPFGGIGASGMGHYHGHEGFLTFSKAKGVFIKQRLNTARLIYPPYGGRLQRLIYHWFLR